MYLRMQSLFSKYLENFERIPRLDSEKPPMCHNGDTVCWTKNRIPRCTPQTITKFITKFSSLTIKRSVQDTGYGARMHACKNKGTHFGTGPTTSSRHSKNNLEIVFFIILDYQLTLSTFLVFVYI